MLEKLNVKMKYCIAFYFVVTLTYKVNSQNFNRPTNKYLYGYEFELLDSTFKDYVLTVPFHFRAFGRGGKSTGSPPIILDKHGYVAMYYVTELDFLPMFKYYEKQNKFSMAQVYTGTIIKGDIHYFILDDKFNVIDTVINSPGIDTEGHEFHLLDNGNRILAGQVMDTVDLSNDTIGGQLGFDSTVLRGFVIEEFDSLNKLLFQWNSNDYVPPSESNLLNGYDRLDFDYCHGNAIEKDKNGDYYVSLRNTNSVYKINGRTRKVIWKLGGVNSSFSFDNDSGFSGQHDIRILDNGNLTVFDNGNTRLPKKYSRALEFSLDTINMRANIEWEYVETGNAYSRAMGNHETSKERHHLINYGATLRPFPSISVCDDQKNDLCRVYFKDSVVSYRSQLMTGNFDLNRPTLSCERNNGKLLLHLDSSYSEVIWSTDESSLAIEITTSGTYQAWVRRGNAMIGSFPVIINDVNEYCSSVSISSIELERKETINAYYNALGQPINIDQHHGFYLEQDQSGDLNKKYKP